MAKTNDRDPLFSLPKKPALRFKECLVNARLLTGAGFLIIVLVYLIDLFLWNRGVPFNPSGSTVVMGIGGVLILFGFGFLAAALTKRLQVPEALLGSQKSLELPFWLTVWTITWGIVLHFASQQVTNPLDPPWLLLQAAWVVPTVYAIYRVHMILGGLVEADGL